MKLIQSPNTEETICKQRFLLLINELPGVVESTKATLNETRSNGQETGTDPETQMNTATRTNAEEPYKYEVTDSVVTNSGDILENITGNSHGTNGISFSKIPLIL